MAREPFEPNTLLDGEIGIWSFDDVTPYSALAGLFDQRLTGVLEVPPEDESNLLFLREGQPVGVQLVEACAPLGQLLLEFGYLDSASYIRAKPEIDSQGRLPGQVYVEAGIIDVSNLKEVLRIQADRKARRLVDLCRGAFRFRRGLQQLVGFTVTPLPQSLLIYLALKRWFDDSAREAFLNALGESQVRTRGALEEPLETLGFDRAEERLLQRMNRWNGVQELDRFGSLPRSELALLLKMLELRQLLQQRPALVEDAEPTPPPTPIPATLPSLPPIVPRPTSPSRREKTERVSISMLGWSEPRPTREERTEIAALPSVIVDLDELDNEEDS